MMHFVSIIPNAGEFHEFKGFTGNIPFECDTSDLKIKEGKIKVPSGPGSGIEIDPAYIAKHKKVEVL
jgi:L-alanine-DL-glutamate epimerase-like enolase superfamily enzyme